MGGTAEVIGTYRLPGVHREDFVPTAPAELVTGVPAFLGYVVREPVDEQNRPIRPQALVLRSDFERLFGPAVPDGYLAATVSGFFDNGGERCYVMALDPAEPLVALRAGLEALVASDDVDLVCAPDIMRRRSGETPPPEELARLQLTVLMHCDTTGDRFAILDSSPGAWPEGVRQQRVPLAGTNGALYYPWVVTSSGAHLPPCGHVAGVYASTDRRWGVHKAPANVVLTGVVDLDVAVSDVQQALLNPEGINCLRAFSGRGIRVWGARTLSAAPEWTYVNVRRLFLTVGRRLERVFAATVAEPNEPSLWARIERDVASYLGSLLRAGALQGNTPADAFYVKCDAETNSRATRDAGAVVTEIGLAPTAPGEFIVVRIIHTPAGTSISVPTAPAP